jgi:hypothetical protein
MVGFDVGINFIRGSDSIQPSSWHRCLAGDAAHEGGKFGDEGRAPIVRLIQLLDIDVDNVEG